MAIIPAASSQVPPLACVVTSTQAQDIDPTKIEEKTSIEPANPPRTEICHEVVPVNGRTGDMSNTFTEIERTVYNLCAADRGSELDSNWRFVTANMVEHRALVQ